MTKISPMLAAKPDASFVPSFPCHASPKIDGIRALIKDGVVLSRSGKPIPNPHVQKLFGHLHGFDGELIVGEPTASDCFRASQAVMAKSGEPCVTYFAFDLWNDPSPFSSRYAKLRTEEHHASVTVLEQTMLHSQAELDAYEAACLTMGYEGVMLRRLLSPYKFGRSTLNEGHLVKIKRFADAEAEIISLEEQISLQGNANGVLGALHVRDIESGADFSIGSGFTEDERFAFWRAGESLIGSLVRYRHFPVGAKDKPRFPVFSGLRNSEDMAVA